MKKFLLLLFLLPLISCNKEDEKGKTYYLFGDKDEIPSLYYWQGGNSDPKISGTTKASVEAEIALTETLDKDTRVTGVLHIGYLDVADTYLRDIDKVEFTLTNGNSFKYSGTSTFQGEIFDKAFVKVDIIVHSKKPSTSCPAKIVSSKVNIVK